MIRRSPILLYISLEIGRDWYKLYMRAYRICSAMQLKQRAYFDQIANNQLNLQTAPPLS